MSVFDVLLANGTSELAANEASEVAALSIGRLISQLLISSSVYFLFNLLILIPHHRVSKEPHPLLLLTPSPVALPPKQHLPLAARDLQCRCQALLKARGSQSGGPQGSFTTAIKPDVVSSAHTNRQIYRQTGRRAVRWVKYM